MMSKFMYSDQISKLVAENAMERAFPNLRPTFPPFFRGLNYKHGSKMVVPVTMHVRLLSGINLSQDWILTNSVYFHFVHGFFKNQIKSTLFL